jgi:hypothetical protein
MKKQSKKVWNSEIVINKQWEYTDKETGEMHVTSKCMLVMELINAIEPVKFVTREKISKELENYIIDRLNAGGYKVNNKSNTIRTYVNAFTGMSQSSNFGARATEHRRKWLYQIEQIREKFAQKYINRLK